MIAELKKEINERILAAEEGDDLNCELVSLVRQSTFQSQQTIQTNNEAMDINEDSHRQDLVSELVDKFEGDQSINSSVLRDDRSLSFYNLELRARQRKLQLQPAQ